MGFDMFAACRISDKPNRAKWVTSGRVNSFVLNFGSGRVRFDRLCYWVGSRRPSLPVVEIELTRRKGSRVMATV